MDDSAGFWKNQASKYIDWFSSYKSVHGGGFEHGDINWFDGGVLNACYNCIDKHIPTRADQPAMIWEGDELGQSRTITYAELLREGIALYIC